MSVLTRLTVRNLRLNRKRTIVTIIGIILSGAMICGVASLVASFQDMLIRSAELTDGKQHATFEDVPYEGISAIADHAFTKTAMLSRDVGAARLEGVKHEHRPYLFILAYDAEAFRHLPLTLREGRFPEREGEIVVSEELLSHGGAALRIGDTFTVEVGQRIDEQGVRLGHLPLTATETLAVERTETYTVTGIIERPHFQSYDQPGYTAVAFLEAGSLRPGDLTDVSIVAANPRKIYEMVPKLAGLAGASAYQYNSELLRWMGITNNAGLSDTIETIGLIITLLVVVGSVSVIYNAFAISVNERKKQFGMLASVGATRRQIRSMVFLEGLLLGIIGIPIGIASGIGGIAVTLEVVNRVMEDSFLNSGVNMRLVVVPGAIWSSVFFIALTILISAWLPAVRASRVSPIEAIRLTADLRIEGRKLRTSRLTRRLFGIEGELALKNLKRNRKRYRATVFSLFISIVLYVSFSSFMKYGFISSELYYKQADYDFAVEAQDLAWEAKKDYYRQVAALDAVEESVIVRSMYAEVRGLTRGQFSEYVQRRYLDHDDPGIRGMFGDEAAGYRILFRIVAVDEAAFTAYAERLGLDPDAYRDPDHPAGILVNLNKTRYPSIAEFAPLAVEAGTTLTLENFPYDDYFGKLHLPMTVGAVTDQVPLGVGFSDTASIVNLIVAEPWFDAMRAQILERVPSAPEIAESVERLLNQAELFVTVREGTDRRAFVEQVEAMGTGPYAGMNVFVVDPKEVVREMNRTRTVIAIFLYGFVSLIALIGVTNIFNTISTNVALRRREFAMLKSVGLTPAGFNRMLNYECIFYGVRALLFGLPVGVAISFWMYRSIGNIIEFGFTLPWTEILVCTGAVFAVVFATMLQASARLKKENIVDALKEENL
jgi:putative ABC transport system permease protein